MTRLEGYVEKGWGHEMIFATNEKYCGKILYIVKDRKCSWHYHKIKDETFCVAVTSNFDVISTSVG